MRSNEVLVIKLVRARTGIQDSGPLSGPAFSERFQSAAEHSLWVGA